MDAAAAHGTGLGLYNNPELVAVPAFAAASVGGSVEVRDNAALPTCEAEALVLRISAPPNISCYRNLADACVGATCR